MISYDTQELKVIRGNTVKIPVSVYNADGTEYTLSGTDTLRFAVKKDPYDTTIMLEKELTAADNAYDVDLHAYVFTLFPSDTLSMNFGEYIYDVGLQLANSYFTIVECSPFLLYYNVSKKDGGGQ